jgi:hypothetical protein
MWRRLVQIAVPAIALGAVAAHAQSSGGDPATPAARTAAASSLRLPSVDRCLRRGFIRVGLVPPAGASFASVSVRVGEEEVLQLAGLSGPGRVVVHLPRGTSRVHVSGSTTTGRFLAAGQTYRRCARPKPAAAPPKPKPKPRPAPTQVPVVQGGGED